MRAAPFLTLILCSTAGTAAAADFDAGASRPALALTLAAPPASPAPAPDLSVQAPSSPAPAPSLDFDLLAPAAAVAAVDPAQEQAVDRRRSMLKVHQGLGIATVATLAATSVVGQLDFNDRFRGGGDTGQYHTAHKALAYGSAALFTTAGLLAVLAPEPYAKKGGRADTATVHKWAMGVATAGMVAQIALGIAARGKAGTTQERDIAAAHQIIGYTTLGATTVGAAVLFF